MIKLILIKFKITRRKKNLQKKKKDHEMNHQNFLNRHARHRPRFVTSVSLLPVAAFRKTPLESKASFSLSIAWNYGLRILVLKRIGQPACCCCYCLSETILRKAVPRGGVWGLLRGTRCWQRQVVVEERRQVHLGFSGSGHRPSSIRYLRISLVGRIPGLRGN